jgi:putative copper resistance protein D
MLATLLIVARAAHISASILISGTFTFEVVALGLPVCNDSPAIERLLLRLVICGLIAALLSAVLWFWLAAANMSGLSVANVFSVETARTVLLETKFGHVWQFRLVLIGLVFAFGVLSLARNEARRRPLIVVVWFLSVVFLVSLAWISHAAAVTVQPLGLLSDALHLCAAGSWIGGLVPLTIFLTYARASSSSGEKAAGVLSRFSNLSLCCVSVLVISGISNGWLLVGSMHAFFTTVYGRLLLSKLALFGILLGFAARNRFVVKTKLRAGPAASNFVSELRRNVICEACLGAAVVAIVACMGVTPPARHP